MTMSTQGRWGRGQKQLIILACLILIVLIISKVEGLGVFHARRINGYDCHCQRKFENCRSAGRTQTDVGCNYIIYRKYQCSQEFRVTDGEVQYYSDPNKPLPCTEKISIISTVEAEGVFHSRRINGYACHCQKKFERCIDGRAQTVSGCNKIIRRKFQCAEKFRVTHGQLHYDSDRKKPLPCQEK